jgi:hypothetical protein
MAIEDEPHSLGGELSRFQRMPAMTMNMPITAAPVHDGGQLIVWRDSSRIGPTHFTRGQLNGKDIVVARLDRDTDV